MNPTVSRCSGTAVVDEPRPFRVLLVDAQQLFRQALQSLVASDRRFTVVGETGRAREAQELVTSLEVDLVLMELHLPDADGLELITELRARRPSVAIVVLTALRAWGVATSARRAGALGYLPKNVGSDELLRALHRVARGRWYCARIPPPRSRARTDAGDASSAPAGYLTSRQREVLRSVALGYSTREIAVSLGVSVKAIQRQREQVRHALRLSNTAELTRFAVREGLVPEVSRPTD